METAVGMRSRASAARSERDPLPVPANEDGALYRRILVVELSPWLCNASVVLNAAGIHSPPLDTADGSWAQRFADRVLTWLQGARQRQLITLSDNMLKDIGLSRAKVDCEIRRRFWQG